MISFYLCHNFYEVNIKLNLRFKSYKEDMQGIQGIVVQSRVEASDVFQSDMQRRGGGGGHVVFISMKKQDTIRSEDRKEWQEY